MLDGFGFGLPRGEEAAPRPDINVEVTAAGKPAMVAWSDRLAISSTSK